MKHRVVILLLVGWVLWFTQEESRPTLFLPRHWSALGMFDTKSACEAFGQTLIDQLGCIPPQKGYTRGTAAMTMLDTCREGSENGIKHEVQTSLYCISDDIDPRIGTMR